MITPADGLEDALASLAGFGSIAALFALCGAVAVGVRFVMRAGRQV